MIIYDVTQRATFLELKFFKDLIFRYLQIILIESKKPGVSLPIILVGNKIDLPSEQRYASLLILLNCLDKSLQMKENNWQ